jgi:hypothetical protein
MGLGLGAATFRANMKRSIGYFVGAPAQEMGLRLGAVHLLPYRDMLGHQTAQMGSQCKLIRFCNATINAMDNQRSV